MASGVPAISTDVAGVGEIVDRGSAGMLVPQRDARALATALQRLLADEPLRTTLAARGRNVVELSGGFSARALLKSLRPHQWVKSVFVLLGPLYGLRDIPRERWQAVIFQGLIAAGVFNSPLTRIGKAELVYIYRVIVNRWMTDTKAGFINTRN